MKDFYLQLFPEATFFADERKWYAMGQFESTTGTEPAVTVYEEVIW
jgi:hypothetical protein